MVIEPAWKRWTDHIPHCGSLQRKPTCLKNHEVLNPALPDDDFDGVVRIVQIVQGVQWHLRRCKCDRRNDDVR
jgi:hypothetical protein